VDVESLFRAYDPKLTGSLRRTELLEVLSKLGMYILEQVRDGCLVLVLVVCVGRARSARLVEYTVWQLLLLAHWWAVSARKPP
jgi:hypothetical protein